MFTGIIKTTGIVQGKKRNLLTIKVNSEIARTVLKGGSVSIDGACLTVLKRARRILSFELMDSTFKRTTLGQIKIGAMVNVEPALLVGQPLGGHFVSGHVDGVGVIQGWKKPYLTVESPKKLMKYLIPQGSVALNGVSLTIVGVKKDLFFVALTDYTLEHTNLANPQKSDKVNIEVDFLAKYLEKLCTQ